jgi:hypothetical protein
MACNLSTPFCFVRYRAAEGLCGIWAPHQGKKMMKKYTWDVYHQEPIHNPVISYLGGRVDDFLSIERTRCLRWLRTASSWPKSLSLPETLWILRSMPLQLKIRHNKSQREMRANRTTRVPFECTSCYTKCSAENDSINRHHLRGERGHFCSIAVNCGHIFSERTHAKIINKSSGTKRRWWTLFLPIENLGWPNWELVTCEFYVRSRGATRW